MGDKMSKVGFEQAAKQMAKDYLEMNKHKLRDCKGVISKALKDAYLTGAEDAARLVEDQFDISAILD